MYNAPPLLIAPSTPLLSVSHLFYLSITLDIFFFLVTVDEPVK